MTAIVLVMIRIVLERIPTLFALGLSTKQEVQNPCHEAMIFRVWWTAGAHSATLSSVQVAKGKILEGTVRTVRLESSAAVITCVETVPRADFLISLV